MMNTAGQVIGSEIQVATGTNVAHPQVAWVRDPLTETGRWIVGFDADQECIPGVINGYTWTVVVNFNGTVGQSNPLGWCGGMGWTGCTSEPPRKAYSTAATAESADGIRWTKPDLGLVEFRGSRHNNIVQLAPHRLALAVEVGALGELVGDGDLEGPALRSKGLIEKCTYCIHRLRKAESRAQAEGRAFRPDEYMPACVQTCTAKARFFGDLDDPNSSVSQLAKSTRSFRLQEDVGTHPKTIYLVEG